MRTFSKTPAVVGASWGLPQRLGHERRGSRDAGARRRVPGSETRRKSRWRRESPKRHPYGFLQAWY